LGDPMGQPKAMFPGAGGEGWPGSGARPGRPPAGLHGPEGRGPPPPLRRHARCAPRVRRGKTPEAFGGLQGLLDGARDPGEVVAGGVPEGPVRRYPVQALASGELSPPGRGWLRRDLTWGRARPPRKSCPCARLLAPATGVRRPSPPEPPPLPSSGVGPSPPPQGESLPFRGRGNPHS
jgi:hypothetical protein